MSSPRRILAMMLLWFVAGPALPAWAEDAPLPEAIRKFGEALAAWNEVGDRDERWKVEGEFASALRALGGESDPRVLACLLDAIEAKPADLGFHGPEEAARLAAERLLGPDRRSFQITLIACAPFLGGKPLERLQERIAAERLSEGLCGLREYHPEWALAVARRWMRDGISPESPAGEDAIETVMTLGGADDLELVSPAHLPTSYYPLRWKILYRRFAYRGGVEVPRHPPDPDAGEAGK